MENKKETKILFIAESMCKTWQFMHEINILKHDYPNRLDHTYQGDIHLTDSLADAKKIVDAGGVDKVIMFPLFLNTYGYNFLSEHPMDIKYSAGYLFWKQELEEKKIPAIIVNVYSSGLKFAAGPIKALFSQEDWRNNPYVFNFGSNSSETDGLSLAKNLVEKILE